MKGSVVKPDKVTDLYIECPPGTHAFNSYRWKRYLLESDTYTGANMRLYQAWKHLKRTVYKTLKYAFR